MLKFTQQDGSNLSYTVAGRLTRHDLDRYYRTVDACYRCYGKLHLTATASDFRGYAGPASLWVFLTREPRLLRKVATYTLYADQKWLRRVVNGLDVLTPGIRLSAKPPTAPSGSTTVGGDREA